MTDSTEHAAPHAGEHHDDHGHHGPHVVSYKMLFGIFAALMVLTILTVTATNLDIGRAGNVAIAIGIAAVKAFLVGAFFMHLWWDRPFNSFILVGSLLFVSMFIGYALIDTGEYIPAAVQPADQQGEYQRVELPPQ